MTPLSGQPAVIEIEPSDHGSNVKGTVDGVELVVCSRDLGAVRNNSALYSGAEDVPALLEAEALKAAAKGVNKDPACGVELCTN